MKTFPASPSSIFLGKRIERTRLHLGLTRLHVAKVLRETEQQIRKYEQGGFISLPKIEQIAELFGAPIQKKLIRRISTIRKFGQEHDTIYDEELKELYNEAFEDRDHPS
jgi:transcriptional regulator with XRE-family HTH domain